METGETNALGLLGAVVVLHWPVVVPFLSGSPLSQEFRVVRYVYTSFRMLTEGQQSMVARKNATPPRPLTETLRYYLASTSLIKEGPIRTRGYTRL